MDSAAYKSIIFKRKRGEEHTFQSSNFKAHWLSRIQKRQKGKKKKKKQKKSALAQQVNSHYSGHCHYSNGESYIRAILQYRKCSNTEHHSQNETVQKMTLRQPCCIITSGLRYFSQTCRTINNQNVNDSSDASRHNHRNNTMQVKQLKLCSTTGERVDIIGLSTKLMHLDPFRSSTFPAEFHLASAAATM